SICMARAPGEKKKRRPSRAATVSPGALRLTLQEMRGKTSGYRELGDGLRSERTRSGAGRRTALRARARLAGAEKAGPASPGTRRPDGDRLPCQPAFQVVGQGGRGGVAPCGLFSQAFQTHQLQIARYLRPQPPGRGRLRGLDLLQQLQVVAPREGQPPGEN